MTKINPFFRHLLSTLNSFTTPTDSEEYFFFQVYIWGDGGSAAAAGKNEAAAGKLADVTCSPRKVRSSGFYSNLRQDAVKG
jgi:hypothetical protein